MLNIYLVRHGQNIDNANGVLNGHRDYPLTELGREQARTLASAIKSADMKFDVVYSSPLRRAYMTAETVTDALGMQKPIVFNALIERDFGSMTGRFIKDIEMLCAPNIIKADPIVYFVSPEGAETFKQMIERGRRLLGEIEARHADGDILLVGHGDMGKMIYAAYHGLGWRDILTTFHFGNSELVLLQKGLPHDKAHVFRFEQFNH